MTTLSGVLLSWFDLEKLAVFLYADFLHRHRALTKNQHIKKPVYSQSKISLKAPVYVPSRYKASALTFLVFRFFVRCCA